MPELAAALEVFHFSQCLWMERPGRGGRTNCRRMKSHLGKAGLIWIGFVAEADDAITLCGYACLGQLQGRLRNDQILAAAHLSTTAITT